MSICTEEPQRTTYSRGEEAKLLSNKQIWTKISLVFIQKFGKSLEHVQADSVWILEFSQNCLVQKLSFYS